MNKKLKKLLAEEQKKFKMLVEYDFFIDPELEDETLNEDEEEDEFDGEAPEEAEMGSEEPEGAPDGEEELSFDGEPISDEGGMEDEEEMDMGPEMEPEGEITIGDDEISEEDDEIELDITDLVDSNEEIKDASEEANDKVSMLMQKFAELESHLPKMDMIGKKIEALQKDIELRNPTEVEKLEMRSMHSFPYSVKLTDYWEDKKPAGYELSDGSNNEREEEYVLTQDEVDADYSESRIKNSFDEYTEEDI
jgi:hypothetical protein